MSNEYTGHEYMRQMNDWCTMAGSQTADQWMRVIINVYQLVCAQL